MRVQTPLLLLLLRLVVEDEELRIDEWDRLILISLILDEILARRSDPASLTLDMDVSRRVLGEICRDSQRVPL